MRALPTRNAGSPALACQAARLAAVERTSTQVVRRSVLGMGASRRRGRPKIVQYGVWAWRGGLRGAPQQLGQHFALAFKRLALLRECLGQGLPLALQGLPLALQRLADDAGAFPHIGGHLVNFFVAPAAGLLHLRQPPEDCSQPCTADEQLGDLNPARPVSGLERYDCLSRQLYKFSFHPVRSARKPRIFLLS